MRRVKLFPASPGGIRRFRCPQCMRLCEHPPFWLDHYMIGYGYCDLCGRWTPIEGGDALGEVKVDAQGRRYTVVYGKAGGGRDA
ncbi:MAG: hypothetical protein WCF57_02475 [Pyrinomonadaceae bacterium]